jgi:hypothetical protein
MHAHQQQDEQLIEVNCQVAFGIERSFMKIRVYCDHREK